MATITISGCQPSTRDPKATDGGNITFQSGDNKTYFIDFAHNNSVLSDQTFPLEVPAKGSVRLNIKGDAPKQTYPYRILNADRKQCCPQVTDGPGEEPPTVIVD